MLEEDTEGYPDDTGYATLDELMKAVYAHGDEWRAESGPVAAPSSADELFAFQRYHGGALVLYALRQKVGNAAFVRIERAYPDRFRDRSVTHGRLHRARRAGLRPPRRRAVPARLGLRHQDAADARPPGLDGQRAGDAAHAHDAEPEGSQVRCSPRGRRPGRSRTRARRPAATRPRTSGGRRRRLVDETGLEQRPVQRSAAVHADDLRAELRDRGPGELPRVAVEQVAPDADDE